MGFVALWQFEVDEERFAEFERVYGPDGDWARLFRRAPGFVETVLVRSLTWPSRYVTMDRWESRLAWTGFLEAFGADYRRLDEVTAGLARAEFRVGEFSETVVGVNPATPPPAGR